MHLIWNPSRGALPYGCEIIAEKADFLSRPKSAENQNPELVDRDDEILF
jgi:single-strand DNA-binding protein